MDYRDIDWQSDRPDLAAIAGDWDRTVIVQRQNLDERLMAVVAALKTTHMIGGAQLAQFTIDAAPAVRWALSRNRWNAFDLFDRFFRHQSVVDALPAITTIKPSISDFQMESTFTAYGRLAGWIKSGGAYGQFAGSDEDALALTEDFMNAVCGMRLSETSTWVNWKPWTDWFQEVAWDGTFFWFDTQLGVVTILLITDTD